MRNHISKVHRVCFGPLCKCFCFLASFPSSSSASSPCLLPLLHLLLLLPQASMRHCGQYLSLAVPGLAERRPSLLLGDRVIVCEPGENPTCTTYASCLIVNSCPLVPGHGGGVEEGIVRESIVTYMYANSHLVIVTVLPWQQVVMRLVHTGKGTYTR